MTEQEMKKLSRGELLQIIVMQSKENEELRAQCNLQLEQVKAQLNREIDQLKSLRATETDELNALHAEELENLQAQLEEVRAQSAAEIEDMKARHATEVERLVTELKQMRGELTDRKIIIAQSGNIAEAAMNLNHIFEDAERAVEQYKENIRLLSEDQEVIAKAKEEEAQKKANEMIALAEVQAARIKREADDYWNQVSKRLEAFYNEHSGLRELLHGLDNKSTV